MNYIETLRPIIEQAGHLALALRTEGLITSTKSDGTPVTNADVAVGEFLTRELLAAFPDTRVVSEEHSDYSGLDHPLTWIIDPIDGTKKYAAGKNVWCVMVALVDTAPIVSMVYFPQGPAWYYAERGKGAYLEYEEKKQLLQVPLPEQPPRFVHTPNSAFAVGERGGSGFMRQVRRLLFARNEGCVRGPIHYWDLAAPALIATEAGAIVVDVQTNPISYTHESCIAHGVLLTTPRALPALLAAMHEKGNV